MVYGDLQFFDIIIFAAIAVFLIYRLRSVLGKRAGFQKTKSVNTEQIKNTNKTKDKIPQLKDSEEKLSTIYEKVENFDHKNFLDGAKKAFEIIITAFNQGDKKTLKQLVSKDVFKAFEKAIDQKLNNPKSQFYSLIIEGVESALIEKNTIKITVIFLSEQLKNNDENSIVKKQDVWTFEKDINNKNPVWTLTST
tara:strand:- start:69 stop:650 length:582 start_codon:yes stop_codon:yes gene_type:complete